MLHQITKLRSPLDQAYFDFKKFEEDFFRLKTIDYVDLMM